ncbi:MAG TPA: SEC-C metal-binding domain-containing protein, partial [Thermoguttaceae bacterium]|nr:SEC-C metal-binding domain-containing protein [Thermoguttaceae bacterium]
MKAGRNDACPCGSGKKYKTCCLAKDRSREPDDRLEPPEPRWDVTEKDYEAARADSSEWPDE